MRSRGNLKGFTSRWFRLIDREEVIARQQGYCWWCGIVLSGKVDIHHRKLRSQGGQDTAENLVALHQLCHNLSREAVHANPKLANSRGFIVKSWQNPEEVRIVCVDGSLINPRTGEEEK